MTGTDPISRRPTDPGNPSLGSSETKSPLDPPRKANSGKHTPSPEVHRRQRSLSDAALKNRHPTNQPPQSTQSTQTAQQDAQEPSAENDANTATDSNGPTTTDEATATTDKAATTTGKATTTTGKATTTDASSIPPGSSSPETSRTDASITKLIISPSLMHAHKTEAQRANERDIQKRANDYWDDKIKTHREQKNGYLDWTIKFFRRGQNKRIVYNIVFSIIPDALASANKFGLGGGVDDPSDIELSFKNPGAIFRQTIPKRKLADELIRDFKDDPQMLAVAHYYKAQQSYGNMLAEFFRGLASAVEGFAPLTLWTVSLTAALTSSAAGAIAWPILVATAGVLVGVLIYKLSAYLYRKAYCRQIESLLHDINQKNGSYWKNPLYRRFKAGLDEIHPGRLSEEVPLGVETESTSEMNQASTSQASARELNPRPTESNTPDLQTSGATPAQKDSAPSEAEVAAVTTALYATLFRQKFSFIMEYLLDRLDIETEDEGPLVEGSPTVEYTLLRLGLRPDEVNDLKRWKGDIKAMKETPNPDPTELKILESKIKHKFRLALSFNSSIKLDEG